MMLACLYMATVLFTDFVGPLDKVPWASKAFMVDGKRVTGHDFGMVPVGAQLHHEFKMTNIWAVPLKIETTSSSDSVTVTLDKEVIFPNGSATLQVDMDGRRFLGKKDVRIVVTLIEASPLPKFQSTTTLKILAITPTPIKSVKEEKPATNPVPAAIAPIVPSNPQTSVSESCVCCVPQCEPCHRQRCCRRRCCR